MDMARGEGMSYGREREEGGKKGRGEEEEEGKRREGKAKKSRQPELSLPKAGWHPWPCAPFAQTGFLKVGLQARRPIGIPSPASSASQRPPFQSERASALAFTHTHPLTHNSSCSSSPFSSYLSLLTLPLLSPPSSLNMFAARKIVSSAPRSLVRSQHSTRHQRSSCPSLPYSLSLLWIQTHHLALSLPLPFLSLSLFLRPTTFWPASYPLLATFMRFSNSQRVNHTLTHTHTHTH